MIVSRNQEIHMLAQKLTGLYLEYRGDKMIGPDRYIKVFMSVMSSSERVITISVPTHVGSVNFPLDINPHTTTVQIAPVTIEVVDFAPNVGKEIANAIIVAVTLAAMIRLNGAALDGFAAAKNVQTPSKVLKHLVGWINIELALLNADTSDVLQYMTDVLR
jgi:uncharacterized protein involved in high-affinity Fe2+ transport